jgi:predicted oxidoreductase
MNLIPLEPDMSWITTIATRPLGKTGIQVTPIGLGVMELAGGGDLFGRAFPVIPSSDKNAIIQAALDGGINWFDTAELYGPAFRSAPWPQAPSGALQLKEGTSNRNVD